MTNPKPKTCEYSIVYINCMSIDKAIKELKDREAAAIKDGFSNLRLELREDDYENYYNLVMYGERMETQDEAELREIKEKQQEEWVKQREMAEFERLRKKFGEI